MSYTFKVSQITFGGNGADNPSPLTRDNYHLSDAEQQLSFQSINVISPYQTGGTKSLTGLIVLDPKTGDPLIGPDDLCFQPCPPFC